MPTSWEANAIAMAMAATSQFCLSGDPCARHLHKIASNPHHHLFDRVGFNPCKLSPWRMHIYRPVKTISKNTSNETFSQLIISPLPLRKTYCRLFGGNWTYISNSTHLIVQLVVGFFLSPRILECRKHVPLGNASGYSNHSLSRCTIWLLTASSAPWPV